MSLQHHERPEYQTVALPNYEYVTLLKEYEDILGREKTQELIYRYIYLVKHSLEEGNPDVRKRVFNQLRELQNLVRNGNGGEAPANTPERLTSISEKSLEELNKLLKKLFAVIEAPYTQGSFFGKLYSCKMCGDIFFELAKRNYWAEAQPLYQHFVHLLEAEPELTRKLFLFGIFEGRSQYMIEQYLSSQHQTPTKPPAQQTEHQTPDTQSVEKATRDLAMKVIVAIFREMIEQDSLRLRLPSVVISQGAEDPYYSPSYLEDGYPDTVVYQHPGRLPSNAKIRESAQYGVPNRQTGDLEKRFVRLLVGVECDVPVDTRRRGNVTNATERRFSHIWIPALRLENHQLAQNDIRQLPLSEHNLMTAKRLCSYDTLSYTLAVRLSRSRLAEELEKIANDPHFAVTHGSNSREARAQEQAITIYHAVAGAIEELTDDIPEIGTSILGKAFEYARHIYDLEQWTDDDLKQYLINNVTLLLSFFEPTNRYMRVRSEETITQLFLNHIVHHDLEFYDKLELALILLHSKNTAAFTASLNLDQDEERKLFTFLRGQLGKDRSQATRVLPAALQIKMTNSVPRFMKIRLETIRDKAEPERGEVS